MTSILPLVYPPLVAGLHAGFLGQLQSSLTEETPFLLSSDRQALLELVEYGAPMRHIADELLFSVHRAWADAIEQEHGKTNISVAPFGVSRLFRPIVDERWQHDPLSGQKADPEAIAKQLEDQHPQSRDVLEIRCRSDLFDLHSLFMVHQNLMPYGLYFYGTRGGFTVARIASCTFIESALRYCLGERAIAPCFAGGEIPAATVNQLHLGGFHGVGMPLKKIRMHNRWASPAEYPWHDLFHLIEASIHLPAWKQRAASAFFDVLYNARLTYGVGWVASADDIELLLDLDLDNEESGTLEHVVARVLYNIRAAHGEAAAKKVADQYGKVLKSLKGNKGFRNDPEFVRFKEAVPGLISQSQ
ncbi:MAG TPA: hypothetical protein VLJ37_05115 [bacterium]|nr:hypothetical protein [bacterium]